MSKIRIISFDADGTLVTPDFGQAIWYQGIPQLYARKNGTGFEKAVAVVEKEYQEVGEQRPEWYDIKYWFQHFQLGDYRQVMENYRHKLSYYPEIPQVLASLGKQYMLIVSSGSSREFLSYMLDGFEKHFGRVFSSVSDYGQLKTPEFYSKVCQEMGIEPCEMVHVGDNRDFDFLAAKGAGVEAFHLNRRQESEDARSLTSLDELEARLQER